MVTPHAARSDLQCILLGLGQTIVSCLEVGLRQLEARNTFRLQSIKTRGVFQYRSIAPALHIIQDAGDPLHNRRIGICGPMQPRLELRFKCSIQGGKANRFGGECHIG